MTAHFFRDGDIVRVPGQAGLGVVDGPADTDGKFLVRFDFHSIWEDGGSLEFVAPSPSRPQEG